MECVICIKEKKQAVTRNTEVVGPYFFYIEVYRLYERIIVGSHHSSRLPTLQMIIARQLEEAPQRSRCIGSQALPTMQKQKDTRSSLGSS